MSLKYEPVMSLIYLVIFLTILMHFVLKVLAENILLTHTESTPYPRTKTNTARKAAACSTRFNLY